MDLNKKLIAKYLPFVLIVFGVEILSIIYTLILFWGSPITVLKILYGHLMVSSLGVVLYVVFKITDGVTGLLRWCKDNKE